MAEIETISSCWKNQESLEKFRAFVEPYGKSSDVQFCRAVYRLLNAPEDARATLGDALCVAFCVIFQLLRLVRRVQPRVCWSSTLTMTPTLP